MRRAELIRERREEILRAAGRHGASNLRVFGSVVRGEDGPDSDIDFLVTLEPGRSLLDQAALVEDLEELLGGRVDIVEDDALHWYIRDRVLQEALPL
jgi:predicted nucleotidyltransferase